MRNDRPVTAEAMPHAGRTSRPGVVPAGPARQHPASDGAGPAAGSLPPRPEEIAALRGFSRFYTRKLGLLEDTLLDSELSLTDARILFELAARGRCVAVDLVRELRIDPGYLSRRLSSLARRGLLNRSRDPDDRRRVALALSDRGRTSFERLDTASNAQVGELLARLPGRARGELLAALRAVERLLEPAAPPKGPQPDDGITLRPHRVGDIGWVAHRHGVLYAQEYGWDGRFEALVAEIAARFVREFDPQSERCWIAELDGRPVGSVFLVRESATVARLRLLYVEPEARGRAIGGRLVEACIAFAREHGYRELVLWTNDVLVSARRIYEAAGFRLVAEQRHHSFGKDLVGQDWALRLDDPAT